MDTKWSPSRLLAIRRSSCPVTVREQTPRQIQHGTHEHPTSPRTAISAFEHSSSIHARDLLQRSKMPRRYSSYDGHTLTCLGKLQHDNIPISAHSTSSFKDSNSTTSLFEDPYNGLGDGLRLQQVKNEAEIIGDFPVNQRRRLSLPAMSSSGGSISGLVVSSAHVPGQTKRRCSSLISSFDRELRCLRRNSQEEERLQEIYKRLDKQWRAENAFFRQKIQKISKEYQKLVQVSPSVDQWLAATRSQISARGGHHEQDKAVSPRTYNRQL